MTPLKEFTHDIRKEVFEVCHSEHLAHLSSCLSCVDILSVLYNRSWMDYKNLYLSKGHAFVTQYCILKKLKILPPNSVPTGHPVYNPPYINITSGSLGQGLGIAIGATISGKDIVAIIGDSEFREGLVHEVLCYKLANKIENLLLIIDFNSHGAVGKTQITIREMRNILLAYGYKVIICDGHDVDFLSESLSVYPNNTALICETVKGYGIPSIYNGDFIHHFVTNRDDYESYREELHNFCKSAE